MSESNKDRIPEEATKASMGGNFSRKSFLKYAGASAATAATLGLVGCEDEEGMGGGGDNMVNLGTGDVGILNYAYALEQLEAAFYNRVVSDSVYDGSGSSKGGVDISAHAGIMQDIRDHEMAHVDFYAAALGNDAIPGLTPDFSAIDFQDENSILNTALTFENTGVSAYNGAGQLLENTGFLLVAGKIVSVEARHASVIYNLTSPDGGAYASGTVDSNGLDLVRTPQEVLELVAPFIEETLDASGLPQPQ